MFSPLVDEENLVFLEHIDSENYIVRLEFTDSGVRIHRRILKMVEGLTVDESELTYSQMKFLENQSGTLFSTENPLTPVGP